MGPAYFEFNPMSRKQPTPKPKGIKEPPAPPGPPRPPGLGVPAWRMNPPTEPGLYWYSLRTDDRPEAAVLGVLRFCRVWRRDRVLVATAGSSFKPAAEFQRWWAGPLLEPPQEYDDGTGDSWPPTY